jgi:hypothetical protein
VPVREIGESADVLAGLLTDPVPRVRAAAGRAVAVVGEAEHAPPLRRLLTDHQTQDPLDPVGLSEHRDARPECGRRRSVPVIPGTLPPAECTGCPRRIGMPKPQA